MGKGKWYDIDRFFEIYNEQQNKKYPLSKDISLNGKDIKLAPKKGKK